MSTHTSVRDLFVIGNDRRTREQREGDSCVESKVRLYVGLTACRWHKCCTTKLTRGSCTIAHQHLHWQEQGFTRLKCTSFRFRGEIAARLPKSKFGQGQTIRLNDLVIRKGRKRHQHRLLVGAYVLAAHHHATKKLTGCQHHAAPVVVELQLIASGAGRLLHNTEGVMDTSNSRRRKFTWRSQSTSRQCGCCNTGW